MEFRNVPEGKDQLISFMKSQNFTVLKEVKDIYGEPIDLLLAQNNIMSSLNVSAMPEQITFRKPVTYTKIGIL